MRTLILHFADSRYQTQIIRLGTKVLYPLSHHIVPKINVNFYDTVFMLFFILKNYIQEYPQMYYVFGLISIAGDMAQW